MGIVPEKKEAWLGVLIKTMWLTQVVRVETCARNEGVDTRGKSYFPVETGTSGTGWEQCEWAGLLLALTK